MDFEITKLRLLRMSCDRGGIKGLADRIGMSPNTLSLVERGTMRCAAKWQPLIAAALNVPAGDLFDKRGFALVDTRFSSTQACQNV